MSVHCENTGGPMEPDIPPIFLRHPAWFRLENQLQWYDRKSQTNQYYYKGLKAAQIFLAVLIPATNLLPDDYPKWAASIAGILIALLEAVQQMNQHSMLWITYRATAERLKHEKFLFLSGVGPYKNSPDSERLALLAERVEEHVSTEHANWFNETRNANIIKKQGVGK
jgi:hypothetical protein